MKLSEIIIRDLYWKNKKNYNNNKNNKKNKKNIKYQ